MQSATTTTATVTGFRVGAAVLDVTPPRGTAMAGYVARVSRSSGVHDPITVRALQVEDTCLVTIDVCALPQSFCQRVQARTGSPAPGLVVHATHTHSSGRICRGLLGGEADPGWTAALEDACVEAVSRARSRSVPCTLSAGWADDPGVARNRRRPGDPVDDRLPVLQFADAAGHPVATVVSYACHPVVLGADNLLLSADYPGVVRSLLEEPGHTAFFVTGCAGDVNTGHSWRDSISEDGRSRRTFAAAQKVGAELAAAIGRATLAPAPGPHASAVVPVTLRQCVPSRGEIDVELRRHRAELRAAGTASERALAANWAGWAESIADDVEDEPSVRESEWPVSVWRWGGARLVWLPGEPFSVAARWLRPDSTGVSVVAGYSNGVPGYLPPADEYPLGGYEEDDAHRYYGQPGPFLPGSLEQLVDGARQGLVRVASVRDQS